MPATRERIWLAQKAGSHCAGCGKAIGAGNPVWRWRTFVGRGFLGGWRRTVAPHCAKCPKGGRIFQLPAVCEGCGRDVYQHLDYVSHRRTFCCEQCEAKVRTQEARTRRAEARGATRICQLCREHFEPTRADAKFCTARCKQTAYRRRRVMDNKSHASGTFARRNGGAS